MVSLGTQPANRKSGFGHSSPTGARAQDLSRQPARPDLWGARVSNDPGLPDPPLGPPRSLAVPGVCYSALRGLPRRDLHPRETNSVKQMRRHPLRRDARSPHCTRKRPPAPLDLHGIAPSMRTYALSAGPPYRERQGQRVGSASYIRLPSPAKASVLSACG